MKKYLIIIIILLFLFQNAFGIGKWQYRIVNYERSVYKYGFQNWMISQSDQGEMYFANSNGLLEFDGEYWTSYSIPSNIARSVLVDADSIYVGGSSEFGYYKANKRGQLIYRSLSKELLDWGSEVWNIMKVKDLIFFICDNYISIYDLKSKGIKTVTVDAKINCSVVVDQIIYLGTSKGVYQYNINEDMVKFLTNSSFLGGKKIVSILQYDKQLLIITANDGIYCIKENRYKSIDLSPKVKSFIQSNQLFCAAISKTKLLLGSVHDGAYMFDLVDKDYEANFNLSNGLRNNTILSAKFDRDDNLWLGLDKGIAYINLNSPMRPMYANISPIGTGYCSALYNGKLYLGTNQGLFCIDQQDNMSLVEGAVGQIWSLNVIENTLFCSGDYGITIISPTDIYKINIWGSWEVHPLSSNKNRLIVGTYSELYILEKKNKWELSHMIGGYYNSSKGLLEDDEPNNIWVIDHNNMIMKYTFDKEMRSILNTKKYVLSDTIAINNITIRRIDNNIVVCTNEGIYNYSKITDSFDHYKQLESTLEGVEFYEYLYLDKLENIWFVSNGHLKLLPRKQYAYQEKIYNWGLADELIPYYQHVSLIDSTYAIVAVDNGFVRLNIKAAGKQENILPPSIHEIINIRNDSVISYGKIASSKIELSYSLNSIRLQFASTNYESLPETLYSFRLVGLDDEVWSTPSGTTYKEYSNLPEGEYIFEVKAFSGNLASTSNEVASIKIKILPPWYRSLYAYICYFLVFAIIMYIMYVKTIRKQKRIIREKGEELKERNYIYEREQKEKDQEIYKLQSENLKKKLELKTQELTGYILNLTRKNEMLESVKKKAVTVLKTIDDEKQINIIRQQILHLIKKIDDNIEHDSDFEIFKKNFDLAHQNFFKLLDERFPNLNNNDKILCAYLKMNLTSKEIAPLQGISIRGVEVNRYRLRKKMGLDRSINISEYLQKL